MDKFTVFLTKEEANAVCFALYCTAGDLNQMVVGCFNHPCDETNDTPESRLDTVNRWRVYRDTMDDVRDKISTLLINDKMKETADGE